MLNRGDLFEAYCRMTGSCHAVWNWKLDLSLQVAETDCPYPELWSLLQPEEMHRTLGERMGTAPYKPLIFVIGSGLCWIAAFEMGSDIVTSVYLKGPFFAGTSDVKIVTELLKGMKASEEQKKIVERAAVGLPVLVSAEMFLYARMLHFCLREEAVTADEVGMVTVGAGPVKRPRNGADPFAGGSEGWKLEQRLLQKVREGNLSVNQDIARMNTSPEKSTSKVPGSLSDLRGKLNVLLTLVSRAAVEGGLAQKTAFSLCSEYRARIEACRSRGELTLLSNDMILDYVRRVHEAKDYALCTPAIRRCCEYIRSHPAEKLSLEVLAEKSGYTKYHLSRKFHAELGCSITEYIRRSKIDQAKFLLENTDRPVVEIAEALGFGTRTYFTEVFERSEGVSPSDYRKKNRVV